MVVPLVTLQILLAGPAVRLLFAAKWEPSIPLIRLLSAAPLLYATIWPMAGIFGATGRFRASFFVWLFGAISFFAMVAPATRLYGAMGTAGAVACWGWLMATAYALTTYRSISGLKAVADAVRGPWISAAAGAVPCAFIVSLLPHRTAYDVLAIALVVPTVLGIYFTILRRLDRPSVDAIVSRLRGIIPRVKARSSPEPRRSAGDPGMNRSLS
jgi:O-antigen/teichoic acid export membrane protein